MKNKKNLIFLLLLIPAGIFVYLQNPGEGPIFPCVFYNTTGILCPGCGMTRAVNSLMHLDIRRALGYNLLPLILLPFGIYIFAVRNKRKKREITAIIMVFISLVFMVLRNIPYFYFLAP